MMKKILELVFLMCLTGGLLYAGEVALVTDLSGDVTASWLEPVVADEKSADVERGRHQWQVELAEMLPAGANVKTGKESALTIVHLSGNVEYKFGADTHARITEEGVEGEAIASASMQLVSTDIQLTSAMQNQVGAVVAEREHLEPVSNEEPHTDSLINTNATKQDSFGDDTFDGKERETRQSEITTQDGSPVVPQPTVPQGPVSTSEPLSSTDSPDKLAEGVSGTLPGGSTVVTQENKKKTVEIETGFALPVEMLEGVSTNIENLHVKDCNAKIITDYEGWVNIRFTRLATDSVYELLLKGDDGSRTITMHVEPAEKDGKPSIALAWWFEKRGLLAQAASIWLQLIAEGSVDDARAAMHLKRIRNTLLKG